MSGFGGPSHQNTTQFIDFRDVPFVSGTTSAVYVADVTHPTQSGTMEIVAGTTVEATVELAGNYTNTIFTVTDDGTGHVKVTDPPGTTVWRQYDGHWERPDRRDCSQ